VLPPAVETLAVEPAVREPAEESMRVAVRLPGVPLKLAAGRKRREVPAASSSAEEGEREVAMDCQAEPLNHCQEPWEAVAALAVMATPARVWALEPPLTASLVSLKLVEKREETEAPAGLVVSSATEAREAEPSGYGCSSGPCPPR
jgi:hypothetical protein